MTNFHSLSEEKRIKAILLTRTDKELKVIAELGTNNPMRDLAIKIVEARDLLGLKNPNNT